MCTFATGNPFFSIVLHMKTIRLIVALCLTTVFRTADAATYYTTFLTAARGFTEVTSMEDFITGNDYCYILTAAENRRFIVGVGRYEVKPDWASEDTKALRYRSADGDPVYDLTNFFTIAKEGQYIGLRNVVFNSSFFQTHDNAGFMYVLTYTEPTFRNWCYLTPTYQNGYWLFESGKYPISSDNWACGYLGPWNKIVADGEPIALNRRNTTDDKAGHYRLFRITRADLLTLRKNLLLKASEKTPVDFTWKITNPSFETGDETGWTLNNKEDGNDEFKTRDYGMTNKHGSYLMNAYQWWAPSLSVSQTVTGLPGGVYELSGVVATWEGRTVTLTGNGATVTTTGINDATGIPTSVTVTVGVDQTLDINAGSTGQWWIEGHESETQTFFKLDNVRLACKGISLDGLAVALPNDTTRLIAGQWYYYDSNYYTEYQIVGQLRGLVYSSDGNQLANAVTTRLAQRIMTLDKGRYYFQTSRNDVMLTIAPRRHIQQGTFTAVALNVDGLPNKIATVELNPDGPGSAGTKLISQYLAAKNYDIIGVSEDFNYHGSLMESLNDEYSSGTVRATLSVENLPWDEIIQLNFRFDTDGLNLIWKNGTVSAANESWTQWNSMIETDGNQYVKKGFRHYDLTLAEGCIIDVYILHMDAGGTNATSSRESQWQQLADAINSADLTRPKLIIGDTNSRWTREDIATNFQNCLNTELTMSDVWVEFCRGGVYPTTNMNDLTDKSNPTNYSNYEIVDKIIYINPTAANTFQLTPQNFRIEQDYTYGAVQGSDNATPLGDHNPVVVTFAYTKLGDLRTLDVALVDNSNNNSGTLASIKGSTANVTLSGRTLYKDGSWNALCLPFDLTVDGSIFDGAIIKELDVEGTYDTLHQTGLDGTVLYLSFKDAETIKAGKPYIIKWENGEPLVNPTFNDVTVITSTPISIPFTGGYFVGNFDALDITASDDHIYYFTTDNSMSAQDEDRTLAACRAYFNLTDIRSIRRIVLCIGDEMTTSVRGTFSKLPESEDGWYTLDGCRLRGLPAKTGIYLKEGRKAVIKNTN